MKMNRWEKAKALLVGTLIAIAVAPQLSGCLFATNGKTEDVKFESTPAGARVVANGVPYGLTPTSAKLPRCQDYDVVIEKPGFEPASVRLSRNESGPDAISSVIDGCLIVPGIIDVWDCSATSLNPNPVNVQLLPITTNTAAPDAHRQASTSGHP
jgi:hypothetical protein